MPHNYRQTERFAKMILQKMHWKSVEKGRPHMTGLKYRCHSRDHGIDRIRKGTFRNHFGGHFPILLSDATLKALNVAFCT